MHHTVVPLSILLLLIPFCFSSNYSLYFYYTESGCNNNASITNVIGTEMENCIPSSCIHYNSTEDGYSVWVKGTCVNSSVIPIPKSGVFGEIEYSAACNEGNMTIFTYYPTKTCVQYGPPANNEYIIVQCSEKTNIQYIYNDAECETLVSTTSFNASVCAPENYYLATQFCNI